MSRRNSLTDIPLLHAIGVFQTGDTVTIEVRDLSDDSIVVLSSNACSEIGATGVFKWPYSNITTPPTTIKEYQYTMTDGVDTANDQLEFDTFGGYPDSINPLGAEDTCKVTFNISRQDDEAGVSPNRLQSDLEKAYAEIQGTFFGNTSYFDANRMKPSYDQLTRQGFWVIPQGATVKFFMKQLNVNTTAVIPALSTIDLNTLLNP